MSTATIIWLCTLGAKLLAALVGLFVAIAKFVDWRRQKHVPAAAKRGSFTLSFDEAHLGKTRRAPMFSSESVEPVARIHDIADFLHTGDLVLFSGRALHSYLIRIPTWSRMSHCGMLERDHQGRLWLNEDVENFRLVNFGWQIWRWRIDKGGFRRSPLFDQVRKYPGQYYVAKVAPEYDKPQLFNREHARGAMAASADWNYGYLGIAFQCLAKLPILREIMYLCTWKRIDTAWRHKPPFCSWAVSIWATLAGQDPTPCLAPQLTTPAEIERSKLWSTKVALIP